MSFKSASARPVVILQGQYLNPYFLMFSSSPLARRITSSVFFTDFEILAFGKSGPNGDKIINGIEFSMRLVDDSDRLGSVYFAKRVLCLAGGADFRRFQAIMNIVADVTAPKFLLYHFDHVTIRIETLIK